MNTSQWLRSKRRSSDEKWNKNAKSSSKCFFGDELIRFTTLIKKKDKSLTIKDQQCHLWCRKLSNRKKGSKQHKTSDTKHQLESTSVSHMALVCLIQPSSGSPRSSQACLVNLQVGNKHQDWRSKKWGTCGQSQRHSTTLVHLRSNIKIRQRVCCPRQRRTLDSATRAEEPYVVTCREAAITSRIAWKTWLPSIISRTTFRAKSRSEEGSSVICLTTSYHTSR